MPHGDGTGPAGMGPMTGRGAGFCAGYGAPGFMNRGVGWGHGAWGGGGRGRRNMYWATGLTGWQRAGGYPQVPFAPYQPTADQERAALKGQVKYMEDSIKEAQERIRELSKDSDKD